MFATATWRPREAAPALAAGTPVTFELPGGREIAITCPLTKAAVLVLLECNPKFMHFAELVDTARNRLDSCGVAAAPGDTDRLAAVLFDGFMTNVLQLRCG
jgi:hypothetical protein